MPHSWPSLDGHGADEGLSVQLPRACRLMRPIPVSDGRVDAEAGQAVSATASGPTGSE